MLDTLKQSTRAYAFFDIARLILNKPERHLVKLAAKPAADGKRAPMWLVSPGENPFLTRDEAIRFLLRRHTNLLWKQIETPIDPPKGNFTFVNRCGFTGELFGPPNYHEYQTRIIRHWKEHFSREMSFDRFKARIETSKTPEAVKMWLEQMSSKAEFECRCCAPAPSKEVAAATPPLAPPADAPVEPAPDVSEAAMSAEPEQPTLDTPPQPPAPAEPDGGVEVTSELPEQSAPKMPPPSTAPEPAPELETEPATAPRFATREEVEKHILANHLDKFVTLATELQISGPASRRIAHDGIHEAVREAWETERGFPLKTATSFQMRLRQDGFHFFKDRKGITYISRIRLKRFEAGQVLTENIQKIVSFLRAHEGATRKRLLAALAPPAKAAAALVAAPAEFNTVAPTTVMIAAAPPETAPAPEAVAPAPGPVPAAIVPVSSPEEEQILRDLHWLIADGFVVELFNGRLWMPPEKQPPPPPAPVVQPVPASASTEAPSTVPAEMPAATAEVPAVPAMDGAAIVPPQETAGSAADVIPPESSSPAPTLPHSQTSTVRE
jgi:hypothetical protein